MKIGQTKKRKLANEYMAIADNYTVFVLIGRVKICYLIGRTQLQKGGVYIFNAISPLAAELTRLFVDRISRIRSKIKFR